MDIEQLYQVYLQSRTVTTDSRTITPGCIFFAFSVGIFSFSSIFGWCCPIEYAADAQKVAVIVHKAYTDKEYADYKQKWLACGEAGGILVSAAIATREKEVMREAMNRGYRLIIVRENGFPPLYKPSGESFDACSNGRLLQVSPWGYHMERRTISREQCLMLNRLVETIVQLP